MIRIRTGLFGVAGLLLSLLPTVAAASVSKPTAEERGACMGDAFSLCGSEIPDVQRVTACMVRKQAELSPGCRVYFRAEHTAVRPIRPHRIRKRVASDADED